MIRQGAFPVSPELTVGSNNSSTVKLGRPRTLLSSINCFVPIKESSDLDDWYLDPDRERDLDHGRTDRSCSELGESLRAFSAYESSSPFLRPAKKKYPESKEHHYSSSLQGSFQWKGRTRSQPKELGLGRDSSTNGSLPERLTLKTARKSNREDLERIFGPRSRKDAALPPQQVELQEKEDKEEDEETEVSQQNKDKFRRVICSVTSLKNPALDAEMKSENCKKLAKAACDSEVRRFIAQIGGVEAIVTAMQNFPCHLKIQKHGCTALCNLCYHCAENREQIRKAGGVKTIIEGMTRYVQNASVQLCACDALRNMVLGGGEFDSTIVHLSGITAIGRALEEHFDNRDVRTSAAKALRMFSNYIVSQQLADVPSISENTAL